MNLEESDSFRDELEKNLKKKKLVIASIIMCALLMILLFALIIYIQYQDSITEKFFLDDKQIAKPTEVYKVVEGITYVDIEKFVNLLKTSQSSTMQYSYQNGNYGLYDEEPSSCLIDNGYETVAIASDKEYYYKYINKAAPEEPIIAGIEVSIKSEYGYSEKFNIENPIRYIDERIYVPLENVPEMLNVRIDWGEYRKRIYSFENLITSATAQIAKMQNNQVMSGYYENLKALIYGYAVLQKADETYYSVYSLQDGSDRLSSKYKDITFVQNVQEFYITADNGTMGLVSADGDSIIKTSEYEKISVLDDDNSLYIVEKNEEYGVISRKGKNVIYTEYDGIGYDTSKFTLESINNSKLLADKLIPVEKNKKYGLFNKDGENVLNVSYDGLGYIAPVSTTSKTTRSKAGEEESILMIPKSEGVNGIVINQGDLYGIFDIDSESLFLPCSFSKIFAIRKSGEIIYYVEFQGEKFELKEYLEKLGMAKNFDLLEKDEQDGENIDNSEEDVQTSNEDENSETTENGQEERNENEKTVQVNLDN